MAIFSDVKKKLFSSPNEPPKLNRFQEAFIRWNAERSKVSEEESGTRYLASLAAVEGGHAGREFRKFCGTAHEVFRVFWSDGRGEVLDAYRFHGPMHFLRMLSYPEFTWEDDHPIVAGVRDHARVVIADYGCGLAQQSIALASKLGDKAELFLVDIPTMRREFLEWFAADLGITCTFATVDEANPVPEFPECHVCIAEQVFEHMYDPIVGFEAIHAGLVSGGFVKTNVADHKDEFMHVTPKLDALRARIAELGYETLVLDRLLRKP